MTSRPATQPAGVSSLNEGQARYFLIDPALRKAGWNLDDRTQVRLEVPVDGYDAEPWNGATDYCLYAPGGEVMAVVEAKRCSRNPREADAQLRHYVVEIARRQSYAPFGFMTNGHQTWFWEEETYLTEYNSRSATLQTANVVGPGKRSSYPSSARRAPWSKRIHFSR